MASTATRGALSAGASAVDGPGSVDEQTERLSDGTEKTLKTGLSAVETLEQSGFAKASIMRVVRTLGGAMIGIAILVVVLNEVFALEQINNSSGSFSGVIDSLSSTGSAALGLLVIGLLVLAANQVMGFFGGGGF